MVNKKNQPNDDQNDEIIVDEREFIIKSATIKDGFLQYSFEPLKGVAKGDIHNVKGAAIIHEDLSNAMGRIAVHLANIDDAFHKAKVRFKDIDALHDHDLTDNYRVSGFVIKGGDDDEKVQIFGSKHVTIGGGRIELKSPAIAINNFSSYKWWNELKAEVDNVRKEVEEYMNGKCTPVADEDEDPAQVRVVFEKLTDKDGSNEGTGGEESDFEKAKVQ